MFCVVWLYWSCSTCSSCVQDPLQRVPGRTGEPSRHRPSLGDDGRGTMHAAWESREEDSPTKAWRERLSAHEATARRTSNNSCGRLILPVLEEGNGTEQEYWEKEPLPFRSEINGGSTSMVWPTLGSRRLRNRTELVYSDQGSGDGGGNTSEENSSILSLMRMR